jgi:hypothetical protein
MNITRKLRLLFRLIGPYPEYLDQVHTLTSKIHFHNILRHFVSYLVSSPSHIPTYNMHSFSIYPISGTHPVDLSFLDLVILRIRGEGCRFWSSAICSILHSSVRSFLLPPHILRSTLYSNTLNVFFLNVTCHVPRTYPQDIKWYFYYVYTNC